MVGLGIAAAAVSLEEGGHAAIIGPVPETIADPA